MGDFIETPMKITPEEVARVAKLARLALSPDELALYAGQLDAILEAFAALSKLDTSGVEAQSHAIPLEIPLREDEVGPSLPAEEALSNAPARAPEGFLVPKTVEK
jgi:aspartyl-tRNA(Asn)/glutamyl-tRNA(Gln) amidotransferase subunit C